MSKSGLCAMQSYYWKRWLRCLSSGFAELAPWTVARLKVSSPWPLPTHLPGVGDDWFVPQLSWKKRVSLWEGGKRERCRVASPEGRSGLLRRHVQYPIATSRGSCSDPAGALGCVLGWAIAASWLGQHPPSKVWRELCAMVEPLCLHSWGVRGDVVPLLAPNACLPCS